MNLHHATRAILLVVLVCGVLTACGTVAISHATSNVASTVFAPRFANSGLVTNEYAYHHTHDPASRLSSAWITTSGSLFAQNHAGWTGPPDRETPNAASSNATDSAVFRLISRRRNFQNVQVTCELYIQRHAVTPGSDVHSYDGVHVWLRYGSQTNVYTMSVMRWDGLVVIKRKSPGGSSNGGTYTTLAIARAPIPSHQWIAISVLAINHQNGVRLAITIAGRPVLDITDTSLDALTQPGAIGIRADNTEFKFRDLQAVGLGDA